MNRLCHIEKTLIKNIEDNKKYPNIEFVLLDYSSNDGLNEWIDRECRVYLESGILKYYRITGFEKFHMAHAKNLAHSFATGDIVCNVDADNLTNADFAFFINYEFNKNKNSIGFPSKFERTDLWGRICISKQNFRKIGGYDERFIGWGCEDDDFKDTANKLGLKSIKIPHIFLDAYGHSDKMRDVNTFLTKKDSYRKNKILLDKKRSNENM